MNRIPITPTVSVGLFYEEIFLLYYDWFKYLFISENCFYTEVIGNK